ncbi:MAG: alpha/beta hydrolase-fold protein, partial [Eubacteriales bacterium]
MAFLEVKFFSDVLGMCMSMNVILPQRSAGKYPTLYLLHGMSDDHTTWSRLTSIERYADAEGIAVVMPTTYLGWYTDMNHGGKYRTFIGEEMYQLYRN